MITKALKQGLSVAFVMAFLVGCSSTSTTDEDAAAGGGVSTGTASGGALGSSDGTQESQQVLETIVYFDFDQAVLLPATRSLLLAHAERLRNSNASVRLEGHADERGAREYNMALGERRANAVRDFLVLQGVNRSSLEVVSYGEERPLVAGSTEAAYNKNRRVEIKY